MPIQGRNNDFTYQNIPYPSYINENSLETFGNFHGNTNHYNNQNFQNDEDINNKPYLKMSYKCDKLNHAEHSLKNSKIFSKQVFPNKTLNEEFNIALNKSYFNN